MSFFKRALLGITRRIGKTLILLAVIFILGNVISGAIAIQQATDNVERTIKERLGTEAIIVDDYERIEELLSENEGKPAETLEELDIDLIHQIGESPYVKYYDYNTAGSYESGNIDFYVDEEIARQIEEGAFVRHQITSLGVNYPAVIDFEEGKGELIDGRTFTEEEIEDDTYVAIIPKTIAEINDLHVGDTFTLLHEVMKPTFSTREKEEVLDSRDVVLEVIGIYESKLNLADLYEDPDDSFAIFERNKYGNTIYVPNGVNYRESDFYKKTQLEYDETYGENTEGLIYTRYNTRYFLNSVDEAEAFRKEITPLLPYHNKIVLKTDEYEKVSDPMESMSKLANYILYIAVTATILITGLVVLLFLRDRRHELGIYLSLGEHRVRVISQIVIEVMVIAVVGITLSLFTGNLLAGEISETMIQVEETEDLVEGGVDRIYFQTSLSTDDVVEAYDIQFDSMYVFAFYGIGLLTIFLSTVIPLIYIVRLNPKQILM